MMHFMMWGFWLAVLALLISCVVLLVRNLSENRAPPSPVAKALAPSPAEPRDHRSLDTRERSLLDPDERSLYELVEATEGDVFQKDLPDITGFSKAKVSRLLDRLERKQLVVRVSHGMTNRVVLAPEMRS